jgi:uncharacterized membrane protein SpoIIM required for sporulation
MAQSAYQVVLQMVWTLGFVLAYVALIGTGRLERFFAALRELVETQPDQSNGPGAPGGGAAFERTLEELIEAAAGLFTPTVLAVTALSVVLAFIAGIVMRALLAGAKVHTARGAMSGASPLVAAIRGTRRDLLSYLGLSVVLFLVFNLPAIMVVGAGLTVFLDATIGGVLTLVAMVLGGLVVLVGWPIAYLLLLFVPESIAADGNGLLAAIRSNVDFLTDEPLKAGTYVAADLGSRLAMFGVVFALSLVGMDRLGGLALLIGLVPMLGLFKMGLYLEDEPTGSADPDDAATTDADSDLASPAATRGPGDRLESGLFDFDVEPLAGPIDRGSYSLDEFQETFVGGVRRSASEFANFLIYRVYLVVVALLLFAVGSVAGWYGASSIGVTFPGQEQEALFGAFGTVPVDDFVQIAANNWIVALGQSFAGIGFGIPSVSNLLFNGMLVGVIAGLQETPLSVFAALIVPHGIIEIPALSISGALGLFLGWKAFNYVLGDEDSEELAAAIRKAFYVLMALLPVFVLASFVETFLTPFVGKAVRALVGA